MQSMHRATPFALMLAIASCSWGRGVRAAATPESGNGTPQAAIVQPESVAGEPLYVVDGQVLGHPRYDSTFVIDPNQVETIEIIKGAEAETRYGKEGRNGVVVITTKKARKKGD